MISRRLVSQRLHLSNISLAPTRGAHSYSIGDVGTSCRSLEYSYFSELPSSYYSFVLIHNKIVDHLLVGDLYFVHSTI
ncbi:unnamed protein product [Caenorhabditis nigoni]